MRRFAHTKFRMLSCYNEIAVDVVRAMRREGEVVQCSDRLARLYLWLTGQS